MREKRFAEAQKKPVICFALVTNQMGNRKEDFEKGDNRGSTDTLKLIGALSKKWNERNGLQCRSGI